MVNPPSIQQLTKFGHKVLIVEDNKEELLLLGFACRKLPWSVRFAQNATEAVAALENACTGSDGEMWSVPELVILDLNLGQDCGIELLRTLRTNVSLHTVPIITWSGATDPAALGEVSQAGGTDFAEKPFNFAKLTALLQRFHSRWLTPHREPEMGDDR